MSLKLKKRESVGTGLRRIIRERLASALRELDRFESDPDDAVHSARKRLKEARAVLRLLRPALPKAIDAYERTVYRDTARPLSGLRDSRILLDSLDRLAGASPEKPLDVASVRKELETRRLHLQQEMAQRGLEPIRHALAAAIARVDGWPVAARNWKTIRDGLQPVYCRGRRSMRNAAEACTDENLHEWRKRSKALWYQLQVLEGAWPGLFEPLAEEVHHLTDLLGDDHDLVVLAGLIRGNGAMGLPPEAREPLLERIASKRARLRQEALKLGRRVYAERTRRFARRVGQYWRTWRSSDRMVEMGSEEGCALTQDAGQS